MPRRKQPSMSPSPAQGGALDVFERAYFSQPGRTQATLVDEIRSVRLAHPQFSPGSRTDFSASTWHAWRRQDTSLRLHDLEILARVSGEAIVVHVEPPGSHTEGTIAETTERLEEVIARLRALPHDAQLVLAGEIKALLKEESGRSPLSADAVPGTGRAR